MTKRARSISHVWGVVIVGLFMAAPAAHAQLDPYEIIDRVDRMYRGASSHGTSTMEVVTENWERLLARPDPGAGQRSRYRDPEGGSGYL